MWQAQPMPDRWTANGTAFRMLSQTPGRAGINGPWVQDAAPVLSHAGGDEWEDGMQDSISFPFYAPASDQWVVFFGSGPRMCCADWLVGLAAAPTPAGPFTRLPTGNPVTLLPPPAWARTGAASCTQGPSMPARPVVWLSIRYAVPLAVQRSGMGCACHMKKSSQRAVASL